MTGTMRRILRNRRLRYVQDRRGFWWVSRAGGVRERAVYQVSAALDRVQEAGAIPGTYHGETGRVRFHLLRRGLAVG